MNTPLHSNFTDPGSSESDTWITFSVAKLEFPPRCCGCLAPTTDESEITSEVNFLIEVLEVITLLTGPTVGQRVEIQFPLCNVCRKRLRFRWVRSLAVCFIVILVLAFGLFAWFGIYPDNSLFSWLCVAGAALMAWPIARPQPPLSARGYSLKQESVQLKFQNAAFMRMMPESARLP